jgi:hypothetical protein
MRPSSETAWNKAGACDAHAKLTSDDNLRTKFERLRDSWIRIANESEIASAAQKQACVNRGREMRPTIDIG